MTGPTGRDLPAHPPTPTDPVKSLLDSTRENALMNGLEIDCPHLWVRRREGSWCARCHAVRWGQDLTDEEREQLRYAEVHNADVRPEPTLDAAETVLYA